MSKQPRTRDLPHTDEGYDTARVEEAFAAFSERVRELETVAGELRDELRSLRAERTAPPLLDDERWPADPVAHPSPDWVAAVPPPLARGLTLPRLAVEATFLLAVALFAGLADLSAAWIALVMAVAWGLVALAEWAAAAKRARWRLDEIAPPLTPEGVAETTGPWAMPVVEATVVAEGPDPESATIVAKLPADPEEPEPEEQADEQEQPRRRLGLRRRRPAEPAADPWET
ncbi:MAG TPA: hypothetical protein VMM55_03650 [Thermohalobaculum sp.]|nr:hypothetical protein [Thermohalobaculum sp.]